MLGRTNTGGGGGGGGLNFKVICNPMPSTAKENTIWVDTDKINNYYFSATQPDNMVEYDVWFPTGTTSATAFNALKKNGIMIYPLSAKQYVSGAWVDVSAKSYQNGEWVEWWGGLKLYDKGNLHTDATGGWLEVLGPSGTVTWNADNVYLGYSSGGGRYSSIYTKNPVQFDDYKKLCIRVSGLTIGDDRFLFGAISTPYTSVGASSAESKYAAFTKLTASNSEEQLLELDVSALSGSYYVQIIGGITNVYIHEIYLE